MFDFQKEWALQSLIFLELILQNHPISALYVLATAL